MVYGQGREARVCRKGEDGQGEHGSKSVKVCKHRIPGSESEGLFREGGNWQGVTKL